MFAYLKGEIAEKNENTIVVDVGGVGFSCMVSAITLNKLPQVGDVAKVYTYLAVREDAMDLFAFADKDEFTAFKLLTSVSGVGPKVALALLSELTFTELAVAISGGDYKPLTRASGVGAKLAQRIVLELKDKIVDSAVSATSSAPVSTQRASVKDAEAIDALVALGYSAADAKKAVTSLNTADMSVEDIIRIALKTMMR